MASNLTPPQQFTVTIGSEEMDLVEVLQELARSSLDFDRLNAYRHANPIFRRRNVFFFLDDIKDGLKEDQLGAFDAVRDRIESLTVEESADVVDRALAMDFPATVESIHQSEGTDAVSSMENPESGRTGFLTRSFSGSEYSIIIEVVDGLTEVLEGCGDAFRAEQILKLREAGGDEYGPQLKGHCEEATLFYENFHQSLIERKQTYEGNKELFSLVVANLNRMKDTPTRFAHVRLALFPPSDDLPVTDHMGEDEPKEEWPASHPDNTDAGSSFE